MTSARKLSGPEPRAARRTISLETRACECCGGTDLESLWKHETEARTRNGWFSFEINNVICHRCGFVFVSPVFSQADLNAYYADAFSSFEAQALDYDPEVRLTFLDEAARCGGSFVEVGAHRPTSFHDELAKRFDAVTLVELNESVSSDTRSLLDVEDASASIVAHYFVLEHVPRVIPFLRQCARILKDGGLMVVEVPDIAYYPRNPNALQLYEHTNHFSPAALETLARRAGFEPVRNRAGASRVIGFAAAFGKVSAAVGDPPIMSEYAINKAYFDAGLQTLKGQASLWTRTAAQIDRLRADGGKLVMWAANDAMAAFLRDHPQPSGTTVIDSDARKRFFLDGHRVEQPDAAAAEIIAADAIFIFSKNHAHDILAGIERDFGKRFDAAQAHIVDALGTKELTDGPAHR
jgi:hypothetical protein